MFYIGIALAAYILYGLGHTVGYNRAIDHAKRYLKERGIKVDE